MVLARAFWSNFGEFDAIYRHAGFDVAIRVVKTLAISLHEKVIEIARLMTDLVPVLFGESDLHIQHAIVGKDIGRR